jgi:hypothetical protein
MAPGRTLVQDEKIAEDFAFVLQHPLQRCKEFCHGSLSRC